MKLRHAKEKIRQAKRTERKMGTTFYKVVTDTNTGDRKIVPVYQHGMPASFAGPFNLPDTIAVLTGIASTAALFYSGIQMHKSKIGNEKINKDQRKNSVILGMAGLAGMVSLMPMGINVTGSSSGGSGGTPPVSIG